ncbi:MAG: UDP-3-O-(3-hydroxymyristoyl)glucosamine N-acyltransferase [Bacteroidia bacterium]|nr:UDP-3-O-(3-hydroxymyristoyl)glucosamine N-acyltransferase [Bacteroidia bacterium]
MIAILDIIKVIKPIEYIGDKAALVKELIQLEARNQNENALYWCSDKNIKQLKDIEKGVVVCSTLVKSIGIKKSCNYLIVDSPRLAFQKIILEFFYQKPVASISDRASIHSSVQLKKNVSVGPNVLIEENCIVGENTSIGANSVILRNTIIGNNVQIGCNNTIGGVGFGYERNEKGEFELIPHIGNVIIRDRVEIGNNTCIDRAVLGSTLIEENVKVDNLVHIAHGVVIGRNSLVIANSMIAGSVVVGENVWIAPSTSVINKCTIEDNAFVGMGAVVLKSVASNTVVVGNPARVLNKKS